VTDGQENGGLVSLHPATGLALELPYARSRRAGGRLHATETRAPDVATALWRFVFGDADARLRAFDDRSRAEAVAFLVELVRTVEARLLEGWLDHAALVRRIADQAVQCDASTRGRLCAQLGIGAPCDSLAAEWLHSLVVELAASLVTAVAPILGATRPRAC
jgi:hypothetical protein